MSDYTSKNENVKTECSMWKTKTSEEILSDIKARLEELNENKPYRMSKEEFNALPPWDKTFVIWYAEQYPWNIIIEGEV